MFTFLSQSIILRNGDVECCCGQKTRTTCKNFTLAEMHLLKQELNFKLFSINQRQI